MPVGASTASFFRDVLLNSCSRVLLPVPAFPVMNRLESDFSSASRIFRKSSLSTSGVFFILQSYSEPVRYFLSCTKTGIFFERFCNGGSVRRRENRQKYSIKQNRVAPRGTTLCKDILRQSTGSFNEPASHHPCTQSLLHQ